MYISVLWIYNFYAILYVNLKFYNAVILNLLKKNL